MPVNNNSIVDVPFWMLNGHWETIIPGLVRNPKELMSRPERIQTPDQDFLDLTYVSQGNNRVVVLSHGLEGNADKYYIRGMAHAFMAQGWDVVAWNCRSCSEEINLMPRLYRHGATEDLDVVVKHTLSKGYQEVLLIGLSLGGSLVVKYLGESAGVVPDQVVGGVAFSIPCQLGSCAQKLSEQGNKFYLNRFLKKLKEKIRRKAVQYPDVFDLEGIENISSFREFDSRYSAPIHGFNDVDDFYTYASAGNYIEGIQLPVLLVNSLNDPMLPSDCYPYELAENHKYFYLETPRRGGHLGYWRPGMKESWAESRATKFVRDVMGIK